MSSSIKSGLSQLKKNELVQLAKSKNINVPKKWTNKQLRELLALNVSKKDVDSIVTVPLKAKTKEGRGYERRFKGEKLEAKVMSIFKRQGFDCTKNVRVRGAEFDVIGMKEGGFFSNAQWIFAECKNKSQVTPADFKKFVGNFNLFRKRKKIEENDVTGYLYTTGLFHKDATSQARKFPNIKLRRIKLANSKK